MARRSTATCASEARPDAVSTLEAVALALPALEGDGAVREELLVPFRELLGQGPRRRHPGQQAGYRRRRR